MRRGIEEESRTRVRVKRRTPRTLKCTSGLRAKLKKSISTMKIVSRTKLLCIGPAALRIHNTMCVDSRVSMSKRSDTRKNISFPESE